MRRAQNNYSGRKKITKRNETEYELREGCDAAERREARRKKALRVRSTLISRLIISTAAVAAAQTDELGTRRVLYVYILYNSYTWCSFFFF